MVGGYLEIRDRRPNDGGGRGFWIGKDCQWRHQVFKLQFVQNRPECGGDNRTNATGIGRQLNFSKPTAL